MQTETAKQLCATCGLCCTSFFSTGYVSNEEEKQTVEEFGGELFNNEDGQLCFRQPCPAYNGNCTVYPNHPLSCQGFECALLKQLLRGEITLEHAVSLVQQTQEAVSQVDATLFPLLGDRKIPTIDYMRQFFILLEDEKNTKGFKQSYAKALAAHAVFMFLRNKYFDES